MKLLVIIFIILELLILNSSTSIAQSKSLYLQSYAFAPVISDTTIIESGVLEIPKINAGDIGGQLLAGPISGFFFALVGGLAGYAIDPSIHGGASAPIVIGILAGYTVGNAAGVHVAARRDKYDSNFLELLGSSILGELTGIFLYALSNPGTPNTNILATAPLVLPPIFAIVTLNAFQQKKSNISVGFDVQQLPQQNAFSYGMKLQYAF